MSKHKQVRYLGIRGDDEFDEAQFADWVKQASQLPGERMGAASSDARARRIVSLFTGIPPGGTSTTLTMENTMAQNIYDNPDFFAGYTQLPRQVHGLGGAPEWPVVRAMLPEVTGKRIVDLGCGFGWGSRWMREQGAAWVVGIDLSEKMISRAKAGTNDSAIEYRIADLETLELPEAAFDLAYSALTFHYIKDFDRLVRMVHRALTPGGDFIFTIEHPIFMAAVHPHWLTDEDGRKTWPVNRYSIEGERRTDWFAKGVVKYHRTLGTTLNTLIRAGFELLGVEEFAPSPEQIAETPSLAEELERPMMLLVSARR
jgi:SAM-dependent methyltransferase